MTPSIDQRLEDVYHAPSRAALIAAYDDWAASYDADMQGTGYIHPAIITGLVSRYTLNRDAAILDAGVGTGTIGQLLDIMGFSNLLGLDMSEAMLAQARARKIYQQLKLGVLGEALAFETASIDAIVSTGTFTTGHAPASAFDELVRITKSGGHLIFTVGTKVWNEAGFDQKLESLEALGLIEKREVTKIYHPMPLSATESGFTARAHVYRRV